MDIKNLEKEALQKGYYLTKVKTNTKAVIEGYKKLEKPTVLSVLATETGVSSTSIEKILRVWGAELIKSGKTTIVMPPAVEPAKE